MEELGMATGAAYIVICAVNALIFLAIFLNALGIYLGVKMVGEDIAYGKSMVVAGVNSILTPIANGALIMVLGDQVAPWIGISSLIVSSILILSITICFSDEISFGLSVIAAILATILQVGVVVVFIFVISLFASAGGFDDILESLQQQRTEAMQKKSQTQRRPRRENRFTPRNSLREF